MAKKKAIINIQNVVASATLGQDLDLSSIVRAFQGVEYRPELFPGLVFRLKKPKTAALIFRSGKMVCTGAKSERQSRKAVMKVVDELKRNGIVISGKPDIKIQNIVASVVLDGFIDLEKTTCSLEKTMYEPEQFPGLIYRMDDPKVVILMFASGNLVCTGAKKEEEVYEAVAKLQETLEEKELIAYGLHSGSQRMRSESRTGRPLGRTRRMFPSRAKYTGSQLGSEPRLWAPNISHLLMCCNRFTLY